MLEIKIENSEYKINWNKSLKIFIYIKIAKYNILFMILYIILEHIVHNIFIGLSQLWRVKRAEIS